MSEGRGGFRRGRGGLGGHVTKTGGGEVGDRRKGKRVEGRGDVGGGGGGGAGGGWGLLGMRRRRAPR